MAAETSPGSQLSVPRWTDFLSGLQARHPRSWIMIGNLESRMLADRLADVPIAKPIWVTGLARAGTTILLELLARHPDLASHRYRDFPPVLTPWCWNWFVDRAGAQEQAASERAHGDGILVTPESPEAFEEVLWMAFFPHVHEPSENAALSARTKNDGFEAFLRDHIRKILLIRGGKRYLAKANYNVTRLGYLLALFPDAKFVVPFREPAAHIVSLARQHARFSSEHERDDRLRRHMSRSGHFEFGLDRRPINRGDDRTTRRILDAWNEGREIEGWALYWNDIHGYIADLLESSEALRRATLLVDYDRFCSEPEETMRRLMAHAELDPAKGDLVGAAAETIRPVSGRALPLDEEEQAQVDRITAETRDRLREMSRTATPEAAVV